MTDTLWSKVSAIDGLPAARHGASGRRRGAREPSLSTNSTGAGPRRRFPPTPPSLHRRGRGFRHPRVGAPSASISEACFEAPVETFATRRSTRSRNSWTRASRSRRADSMWMASARRAADNSSERCMVRSWYVRRASKKAARSISCRSIRRSTRVSAPPDSSTFLRSWCPAFHGCRRAEHAADGHRYVFEQVDGTAGTVGGFLRHERLSAPAESDPDGPEVVRDHLGGDPVQRLGLRSGPVNDDGRNRDHDRWSHGVRS